MVLKLDRSKFGTCETVKKLTNKAVSNSSKTAADSPSSAPTVRKLVRKSSVDISANAKPVFSSITPNASEKNNQESHLNLVIEGSKSNYVKTSGSSRFSLPSVNKLSLMKSPCGLTSTASSSSTASQVPIVHSNNTSGSRNSESGSIKKLKVMKSFNKTSVKICTPLQKQGTVFKTQSQTSCQSIPSQSSNRKTLVSVHSKRIPQKNNKQAFFPSGQNLLEMTPAQATSNQLRSLKRSASSSKFNKKTSSSSVKITSTSTASSNTLSGTSLNVLQRATPSTSSTPLEKASCSSDANGNADNLNNSLKTDVEMLDVPRLLDLLNKLEDDDNLPYTEESYVFVVDTNIFVHDMIFIDELKDTTFKGCGPPYIYIPYVVLRELDGLKSPNCENRLKAARAVKYVHKLLSSKHPRIYGQKAKTSRKLEKLFGDKNDDLLLSYCIHLAQKIPKEKVCLLTNDKNLCNKAIVNNVKAHTSETLFEDIIPEVRVFRDERHLMDVINQDNPTPSEMSPKLVNEKMETDAIICEAKSILKDILRSFLIKSVQEAFGYRSKQYLKTPPDCLLDILKSYKKYWTPVFSLIFSKDIKEKFERLIKQFGLDRGFICNIDNTLSMLTAIETICAAIAKQKPIIQPQVKRICELIEKCNTQYKLEDKEEEVVEKSASEVVLAVFSHLWCLINRLCGLVMDFAKMSHELQYDKPLITPSFTEFFMLLSNLNPAIQKVKQAMSKVVEVTNLAEQEKFALEYKELYDYLMQFVPSLQFPAEPPTTDFFTVQSLKDFCLDPECREKFKDYYRQLMKYQSMLIDCTRLPIWQS